VAAGVGLGLGRRDGGGLGQRDWHLRARILVLRSPVGGDEFALRRLGGFLSGVGGAGSLRFGVGLQGLVGLLLAFGLAGAPVDGVEDDGNGLGAGDLVVVSGHF